MKTWLKFAIFGVLLIIDLVIIESDGVVKYIYECRSVRCDEKNAPTFGVKIDLDLDYWPF